MQKHGRSWGSLSLDWQDRHSYEYLQIVPPVSASKQYMVSLPRLSGSLTWPMAKARLPLLTTEDTPTPTQARQSSLGVARNSPQSVRHRRMPSRFGPSHCGQSPPPFLPSQKTRGLWLLKTDTKRISKQVFFIVKTTKAL